MKKLALSILLVTFCLAIPNRTEAKKKEVKQTELRINYRYWDKQVVNHRGWYNCPENTLLAIDSAIHHGFKIIECDIAFTKDTVPVLSHDATLNRCTNFKGKVSDFTIDELAIVDFGGKKDKKFKGIRVTNLKEALMLCHRNNVMLELDCGDKSRFPNENYKIIYDLVKRCGMLGSTIFVDEAENIKHLLDIDENVIITITHCSNKDDVAKYLSVAKRAKSASFNFRSNFLTKDLVKYVHDQGFMVKAWTVDNIEEMKKLVGWDVDMITSNKLGPDFNYPVLWAELKD